VRRQMMTGMIRHAYKPKRQERKEGSNRSFLLLSLSSLLLFSL
jgi:hypothetical protein